MDICKLCINNLILISPHFLEGGSLGEQRDPLTPFPAVAVVELGPGGHGLGRAHLDWKGQNVIICLCQSINGYLVLPGLNTILGFCSTAAAAAAGLMTGASSPLKNFQDEPWVCGKEALLKTAVHNSSAMQFES